MPVNFDCGQDLVTVNGKWTTRTGIGEVHISGMKRRKLTLASVSACSQSPYTTHISRCASVACTPFRKKNNKMCRKCTFWSSIFNAQCAHKTRPNNKVSGEMLSYCLTLCQEYGNLWFRQCMLSFSMTNFINRENRGMT